MRAQPTHTPGGRAVEEAFAEALRAAMFVERFWEASDGPRARPGLAGGPLERAVAAELRVLLAAARAADRAARERSFAAAAPMRAAWAARAIVVIQELRAALRWVEASDPRLTALLGRHPRTGRSAGEQRAQLADLAAWATRWRDALAALPAFDPALVDEATALAGRARAARAEELDAPAGARLARRNQLLHALNARVLTVRAAVRFVFREHPELARLAGPKVRRRGMGRAGPESDDG